MSPLHKGDSGKLGKKALWYAASAGAVLGLSASDVDAQIVYVDIDPDLDIMDTFTLPIFAGVGVDFDGDGDAEIFFGEDDAQSYTLADVEAFSDGPDGVTGIVGNLILFGATYFAYFVPVNSGVSIGPGNATITGYHFATFTYSGSDPNGFVGVGDTYIGVQFSFDGASTHYAWLRVEMPAGGGRILVKDFAYESTPDTPITAGLVPVELVSFDGIVSGSDVSLNWATASETNNAGFEVQLENGEDWSVLGFVEGNGTTTEAQTYTFIAKGMDVGTHTFRLKQIDFDGAFEYSPEVEATIEVVGTHQLSNAYPNPFNPQSQFNIAVATAQHVIAELYNVLGRRVAVLYDGTLEANATQVVRIDGSDLASGAYIVRVAGETFSDVRQVTLTR